ncbi:unnamed protein product [Musa banksii]
MVDQGAQPKVGDLQVAVLVQEEVLQLEVAVVDAAAMTEIDSSNQLPEVLAGGGLGEAPGSGDPGEELAPADKLHGEVNPGTGGHDLVKLDHVGVAHHLHGRDLTLNLHHHPGADDRLLIHHLHGDAPPVADVAGEVDLAEGAAAEDATELIAAIEDASTPAILHHGTNGWYNQST